MGRNSGHVSLTTNPGESTNDHSGHKYRDYLAFASGYSGQFLHRSLNSLATNANWCRTSRRSQLPVACISADTETPLSSSRRSFLKSAVALVSISSIPVTHRAFAEPDLELVSYKGPISLGFSFSYPPQWPVKKKPIKTHLSEVLVSNPDDSSTTAGIVVDAVKIDSIDNFGTPQAVGDKVVQIESKKDNVNSAKVVSATSFTKDRLLYYLIDYVVDSSRGIKRYVAKVTVTGKQLYVFTVQAKVDNFEGDTKSTLSRMVESFNVVPQYQ